MDNEAGDEGYLHLHFSLNHEELALIKAGEDNRKGVVSAFHSRLKLPNDFELIARECGGVGEDKYHFATGCEISWLPGLYKAS